jgi:hypothetical protein
MSADKYAKSILEDIQLFYDLIQVLNKAGEDAVARNSVKNAANNICVLPMGVKDVIRRTVPLEVKVTPKSTIIPTVHFDHRSITIVGGAAVQIYKNDTRIKNDNYRQTTDIDAVWWPKIMLPVNIQEQLTGGAEFVNAEKKTYLQQSRNPNSESEEPDVKEPYRYLYNHEKTEMIAHPEFAVVSSSWAIQALAQEYTKQLKIYLTYYITHHGETLTAMARDVFGIESPVIEAATKYDNVFVAGIINVWGYLVIYTKEGERVAATKLIEMTIHDGASSQISNTLQGAQDDIVFSLYNVKADETTPVTMTLSDKIYQVPTLQRLLDQQLFALKNRSGTDTAKVQTTLYRIKYLYKLLLGKQRVTKIDKYEEEFAALCTKDQLKFLCEPAKTRAAALLPTPVPMNPALPTGYAMAPPMYYASMPPAYPPGYYASTPTSYAAAPPYYASTPTSYAAAPPYYASTPTSYATAPPYYASTPTSYATPPPANSRRTHKQKNKDNRIYSKWTGISPDGSDIYELIDIDTGMIVGTEYKRPRKTTQSGEVVSTRKYGPRKGGYLTKKRITQSRKNKRTIK